MSDQPPVSAAPIVVRASPALDQAASGLRYLLLAVAAVASALGYAGVAGKANALLSAVGPVAGMLVFLWGQLRTRQMSKTSATLAGKLDDSIAVAK